MPRDLVLLATLVEMRVAEADAERGQQIVPRLPGRECRDERRVQAAAQVRRNRNVRAQPDSDGIVEEPVELVDRVRLRPLIALLRGEVEIPPANGTVRTVGADDEVVRRRQFPDPHEGRPIGQRRPEREDVGDSPADRARASPVDA